MRITNEPVFTAADMSQATQTSAAIPIYQVFGYAAQFVYTGAPVGTLKIQTSCDQVPQGGGATPVPTNWDDLSGSSVSIAAAGSNTYNVDLAYYSWIRFVYTKTSGTGSLSGRVNMKGI